jgi:hypothetical protein
MDYETKATKSRFREQKIFTEGNSEGFREQAKETKILFYQTENFRYLRYLLLEKFAQEGGGLETAPSLL